MEAPSTKWLYVVKDFTDIESVGKPVVCAIEVEQETELYYFIKRPTGYFDHCSRISKKRYHHKIHKTPQEAADKWVTLMNLKVNQAKREVEHAEQNLKDALNLQMNFSEEQVLYPRE